MKWSSIFFATALAVSGGAVSAATTDLQPALKAAGNNRAQIALAVSETPANESAGMKFLVANMPKTDLESLTAKFLNDDVSLAYKARDEFPWARDVPQPLFFNDVLPYANLDEPRDAWRADLFKKFSPLAAQCKTRREAIIAINKKIRKIVNVKYSVKRKRANQSPRESMQSGLASCSGLSILLCDAFRSVGIPARIAGTPMWSDDSGNHSWVEVWDGAWYFTEYYPDAKGLDHSWLLDKAAFADPKNEMHAIYAASWKPTGAHFPLLWNLKNENVHAVNRTAFYLALAGGQKLPIPAGKGSLVIRAFAHKSGERVATKIAVSANDKVIFRGKTRGDLADPNDVLRVLVPPAKPLIVSFRDAKGRAHKIAVSAPTGHETAVEIDLAAARSR